MRAFTIKLSAALLLYSIAVASYVICTVIVNSVFLSRYPTAWLPYLFFAEAWAEIGIAYLFALYIAKNPQRHTFYIFLAAVLVIIIFYGLITIDPYWIQLAYLLFLIMLGTLLAVMSWNLIHLTFDVIEFKKTGSLITIAGLTSGIIMSFAVIPLINHYPINLLSIILFLLVLVGCFCIFPLKPLYTKPKRIQLGKFPIRYPLFRKLFFTALLITLIATFVDYCFKLKLAEKYSQIQIGTFVAYFTGIGSFLSLIINVAGARYIHRISPANLLVALPVYIVLTSIALIFLPSLWTVAIMLMGRNLFYFGIFNLGRELLLNVLPDQIRVIGQFQVKSMAGPIATLIGSIFLFILAPYITVSLFGVITFLLSIFLVFYIRNLNSFYLTTLREEVQLKRFNISDEIDPLQTKNLIIDALKSKDIDFVRFGFSLLSRANFFNVPSKVLKKLVDSSQYDIQIKALETLALNQQKDIAPFLLKKLKHETNPEVIWALFDTLATLKISDVLTDARKHINDPIAEIRAGAVRCMLSEGNLKDVAEAIHALKDMLESSDNNMRKNTSRIIGGLNIGNLDKELSELIEDSDAVVSARAIDAAVQRKAVELGPVVIGRMSQHGVYFPAEKYLVMLGEKAVPLIMQSIQENIISGSTNFNELIRALASMPNPEVESSLHQLILQNNTIVRNIVAKESAYRSRRYEPSSKFKKQVHDLLLEEVQIIHFLRREEQHHSDNIAKEICSREWMAKKRFLYWLAICTNPKEIINSIPTTMYADRAEQAKTIELMSLIIKNHALSQLMIDVFLNKKIDQESTVNYLDTWLKTVIACENIPFSGGVMHDIQKVFVLRSVDLFKLLPGETLLVLAESTEVLDMHPEQVIFNEGDPPTGLYIIVSGRVDVIKNNKVIAELKENQFFGELALIDNSTRTATITAKTEGTLLFLDKETFDRISDDLPDVLRSIIQVLMRYLRQYLV